MSAVVTGNGKDWVASGQAAFWSRVAIAAIVPGTGFPNSRANAMPCDQSGKVWFWEGSWQKHPRKRTCCTSLSQMDYQVDMIAAADYS